MTSLLQLLVRFTKNLMRSSNSKSCLLIFEKQVNWIHGSFTVAAQTVHMSIGTPCTNIAVPMDESPSACQPEVQALQQNADAVPLLSPP